jgi:hypothetical protein
MTYKSDKPNKELKSQQDLKGWHGQIPLKKGAKKIKIVSVSTPMEYNFY